jgi:hypothetical protein
MDPETQMNVSTTLYNPTAAIVEVRDGKVRFCALFVEDQELEYGSNCPGC